MRYQNIDGKVYSRRLVFSKVVLAYVGDSVNSAIQDAVAKWYASEAGGWIKETSPLPIEIETHKNAKSFGDLVGCIAWLTDAQLTFYELKFK